MRVRALSFVLGIAGVVSIPAGAFSQVQAAQNRIPQQITVNGQLVNGAYVTAPGGQLQSFSCATPQHYTTADGSSQGWACYEQSTGVWLLNAVPPVQPQTAPAPAPAPGPYPVPQQPAVVYQQAPPPTVIYQQPVPATVIYQQPPPTVIYQQPAPATVVYAPAPRPVVVAPAYPSSVVLGEAAIHAAGRIAAAAISHRSREYYYYYDDDRHYGRGRGRRW
jgi:hypothetical protein